MWLAHEGSAAKVATTLGQVTSGRKRWVDGTPVAGQQFEYVFDDIGNRTSTKAGGYVFNGAVSGLRSATYTPNLLNQYTSRTVPNAVDVTGAVPVNGTVSITADWTARGAPIYIDPCQSCPEFTKCMKNNWPKDDAWYFPGIRDCQWAVRSTVSKCGGLLNPPFWAN